MNMLNIVNNVKFKNICSLTKSYLGGGVKYSNILYSELKLSNIKTNKVIVD